MTKNIPSIGLLMLAMLPLVLFGGGCSVLESTATTSKRMIDFVSGKTAIKAAVKMEDQTSADNRRYGINQLADHEFGRREPYTVRYQQIAQTDRDWLVRASAIRALNRSRDASAVQTFIKALSDENAIVRVEAAKALSNVPDPSAAAPLLRAIANNSEDRDVRYWSAKALRHYRQLDVARSLVGQLNSREFSVAWQSRESLVVLTGQDLAYNESAWLEFLTKNPTLFG
jgi:HEAT repeat protein